MANSPHSEQGHIVPHIYIPRMIKGEKWSLPTVNISKCLAESQFCVIQTIFPDAFITYSEIWNSWCDIHRLCVSWALRLRRNLSVSWCLGGGTRGNSCLGRRFLWASRSGHIHAARREARWDRPPTVWVCAADSFTVGIFGWNTKQTLLEGSPGSACGPVSKWVGHNGTKPTAAGLRGPPWPLQAFAARSFSVWGERSVRGLLPLKRSQPRLL